MASTLTTSSIGLLSVIGLLVLAHRQGWLGETPLVRSAFDLRLPGEISAEAVGAFITSLSGLLPPWWKQWQGVPAVIFEVRSDGVEITHHLTVDVAHAEYVVGQLRVAIPGARITPVITDGANRIDFGCELRLSTNRRPLRVEPAADVARALLSAMHVSPGERAVIQLVIAPAPPAKVARREPASPSLLSRLGITHTFTARDTEELRALRAKHSSLLFNGVIRIGVAAASAGRQRQLLGRMLGGYHVTNAPGAHLRRRWLPTSWVVPRLNDAAAPVGYPSTYNARELTALLAWPIGAPQIDGLSLGASRQLPVPRDVGGDGFVLACSNFGEPRPIAVAPEHVTMHAAVTGPSGSGKSTVLASVAVQAMNRGDGLIVIEPHGDLIADVLDRVPRHRLQDVIVLDPTDAERPVGLNILAASHGDPELIVEQVASLFHAIWGEAVGPRSSDILRAALSTLVASGEPMTLAELGPLLAGDEAFRRRLVAGVDDPTVRSFWRWFEQLSGAERAAVVAPILNKARAITMRPRLRQSIGQADGIDFDRVLAERRILLVPLPTGTLGDDAAALLGGIVVAGLWAAALRRNRLPRASRPPVLCVLDEAQRFLHLPTDLGDVFAEARKAGVAFFVATQVLSTLPVKFRQSVLANARTKVVFAPTADDAKLLAREFAPALSADDLRHLGPWEVAITLATASRTASPTTGLTLPLSEPTGLGDEARAYSREHYGRPAADVDAAIEARQHGGELVESVRRRPRSDA